MKMHRRNFLKSSIAALGLTLVPVRPALAALMRENPVDVGLDELHGPVLRLGALDDWEGLKPVGNIKSIQGEALSVEAAGPLPALRDAITMEIELLYPDHMVENALIIRESMSNRQLVEAHAVYDGLNIRFVGFISAISTVQICSHSEITQTVQMHPTSDITYWEE